MKAIFVREKIQNLNFQGNPRHGNSSMGFKPGEDPSGAGTVAAYLPGDVGIGELDIDIGSKEWPNWTTLAWGFQPHGQASPGVFP